MFTGGNFMLNEIPWYVVLFQSLPEGILMLKSGFILFRIDISVKDSLIISFITAIFLYLVRKYFMVYGLHTIFGTILLIILVTLIKKIKVIYSAVGVLMGVLISGVLQIVTVSLLLLINGMQISDLAVYPVLNIILFIPCALIMLLIYLFSKKKGFYLSDLSIYNYDRK